MKRLLLTLSFILYPFAFASAQCVQADNTHPDSVALTWQDNSTDESGFILERKQDAGAYAVLIAAMAANVTAFTDGTVKRGSVPTTYTYRIKAYRDSDKMQSPYSNESCITFAAILPPQPKPLPAPAGLTISAISSSGFRITWEDIEGETGYLIDGKIARSNAAFTQIAALPADTTTYDWTGRKRYTSYCVRVRADRADADYSPITCGTTTK